jgi:hypothetical protein
MQLSTIDPGFYKSSSSVTHSLVKFYAYMILITVHYG